MADALLECHFAVFDRIPAFLESLLVQFECFCEPFRCRQIEEEPDAFFALFNGIVEVIGRFTLPILMTKYMGMGETGIWVSAGVVWVLSGVTAWFRYRAYLFPTLSSSVSDRKHITG